MLLAAALWADATPPETTLTTWVGAIVIGAVLVGDPMVVTVALAACEIELLACRPVASFEVLDAAVPATGVAALLGAPAAPGATADDAPELAELAPVSWTATFEFEVAITGA